MTRIEWEHEKTTTDLYARLAGAQAHVGRLQNWVNDLQAGMYINCVYCGHRYGPDSEVPATMAEVLKQHIEQCPEHPCSKLKARVEALKAENGRLRDALQTARDTIMELYTVMKDRADGILAPGPGPTMTWDEYVAKAPEMLEIDAALASAPQADCRLTMEEKYPTDYRYHTPPEIGALKAFIANAPPADERNDRRKERLEQLLGRVLNSGGIKGKAAGYLRKGIDALNLAVAYQSTAGRAQAECAGWGGEERREAATKSCPECCGSGLTSNHVTGEVECSYCGGTGIDTVAMRERREAMEAVCGAGLEIRRLKGMGLYGEALQFQIDAYNAELDKIAALDKEVPDAE